MLQNISNAALHLVVRFALPNEVVDETREQVALGQVEQRVEHVDARLVQLDEFVRVEGVNLGRLEELESAGAHQYVAVSVDFEQVAVERVEPQSSATDSARNSERLLLRKRASPQSERRVVFELEDVLRVAHGDEVVATQIEAELLVSRRDVLCKRSKSSLSS